MESDGQATAETAQRGDNSPATVLPVSDSSCYATSEERLRGIYVNLLGLASTDVVAGPLPEEELEEGLRHLGFEAASRSELQVFVRTVEQARSVDVSFENFVDEVHRAHVIDGQTTQAFASAAAPIRVTEDAVATPVTQEPNPDISPATEQHDRIPVAGASDLKEAGHKQDVLGSATAQSTQTVLLPAMQIEAKGVQDAVEQHVPKLQEQAKLLAESEVASRSYEHAKMLAEKVGADVHAEQNAAKLMEQAKLLTDNDDVAKIIEQAKTLAGKVGADANAEQNVAKVIEQARRITDREDVSKFIGQAKTLASKVGAEAVSERQFASMPKHEVVDERLFMDCLGAPVEKAIAMVAALKESGLIDDDGYIIGMRTHQLARGHALGPLPEEYANSFEKNKAKAGEFAGNFMDTLQPAMDRASHATDIIKRRLDEIKEDVRELVLEHVYGTMSDVTCIYETVTQNDDELEPGLVGTSSMQQSMEEARKHAKDPLNWTLSLIAPLILRCLYNYYQKLYLVLFVKWIVFGIALAVDHKNLCNPYRPGSGRVSPHEWLALECLWMLSTLFVCINKWRKIRDWRARTDEMLMKQEDRLRILEGDKKMNALERARKKAKEQSLKIEMNREALILMDRLNASWVTKFEILLIPFSIVWELLAADLILHFQCADCPCPFVKCCVYAAFFFFVLTIGYSIAALFITFMMFLAQFDFWANLLKAIAGELDDSIGVPVCSFLADVFVLRKRTTAKDAMGFEIARKLKEAKQLQHDLEMNLEKARANVQRLKASQELLNGELKGERGVETE